MSDRPGFVRIEPYMVQELVNAAHDVCARVVPGVSRDQHGRDFMTVPLPVLQRLCRAFDLSDAAAMSDGVVYWEGG